MKAFAHADKEILDGLARAGFKTNSGDGGFLLTVSICSLDGLANMNIQYFRRGGGYCTYLHRP